MKTSLEKDFSRKKSLWFKGGLEGETSCQVLSLTCSKVIVSKAYTRNCESCVKFLEEGDYASIFCQQF